MKNYQLKFYFRLTWTQLVPTEL